MSPEMEAEKAALVAEDITTRDDFTIPAEETADNKALIIDPVKTNKIHEIETACTQKDIAQLRRLADSAGGFITDDVRRRACKFQQSAIHKTRGSLFSDCLSRAYSSRSLEQDGSRSVRKGKEYHNEGD